MNPPNNHGQRLYLCDLPKDVLLLIFGQLDAVSLLKCTEVCVLFNALITSGIESQYRIQLLKNHLVECEGVYKLSSAQRLQLLDGYEMAWDSTKWKRYVILQDRDDTAPETRYELKSGLLTLQISPRQIQYCWMPSTFKNHLHANEIPNIDAGREIRTEEVMLPVDVWNYTTDPRQDLLVTVGPGRSGYPNPPSHHPVDMHFWEISTGRPHPLALKVNIPVHEGPVNSFFTLKVYGNQVAYLHRVPSLSVHLNTLFILNWKTGDTKALVGSIHGVIFLEEDIILLAVSQHGTVPRLVTIDLKTVPVNLGRPVDIYARHLHAFVLQTSLQYQENLRVEFLPNDTFASKIYSASSRWEEKVKNHSPYLPSTKDSLLVIRLSNMTDRTDDTYITLLLSSMFSVDSTGAPDFRKPKLQQLSTRSQGQFYRWDEWSREAAVFTLPRTVQVATHGLRMLLCSESHLIPSSFRVLCDFNKRRVKVMKQQLEAIKVYYDTHHFSASEHHEYGSPGLFPSSEILQSYGGGLLVDHLPRYGIPFVSNRVHIPQFRGRNLKRTVTRISLWEGGFICQLGNRDYTIFSF